MNSSFRPFLFWLLMVCLFVFPSATIAQNQFFKAYGGSSYEWGMAVLQTSDHGYIAAGLTQSHSHGNNDFFIVRTDSAGNVMWTKSYGGTYIDEAQSMVATDDGGFAISGYAWFSTNNYDYYLIRIDSAGNLLWGKLYGGSNEDKPSGLAYTNDGGFIMCGTSRSFPQSNLLSYIVRTDANGDTLWSKNYALAANLYVSDIKTLADGNFIVSGYNYTFGNDPLLMKIDSAGNVLWAKKYDQSAAGRLVRVNVNADGTFIAAGDYNNSLGYVIKTDSAGQPLWTKTFQGPFGSTTLYDIHPLPHGGYVATGSMERVSINNYDIFLTQLDSTGDTLWARAYYGQTVDNGMALDLTADHGFIVTGNTLSFGSGFGDMFLLKTDSLGREGCTDVANPGVTIPVPPAMTVVACAITVERGGVVWNGPSSFITGCTTLDVCPPLSESSATEQTKGMIIYPTVFENEFSITDCPQGSVLFLYDVCGRVCFQTEIPANGKIEMPSSLISGMYFAEIVDAGKKQIGKIKVVKQ